MANEIDPCQLESNLVLSNEAYTAFKRDIDHITKGDFNHSAAYNIVGLPRLATYDAENQPESITERTSQPAFVAAQVRLLGEIFSSSVSDAEKLQQFKGFHSFFRQSLLNLAERHGVPFGPGGNRLVKPYPPPRAARLPGYCR